MDLLSQPAEITFTLTIKRAATGLVETYHMVGHIAPSAPDHAPEESNDRHPLGSSPDRSD